ncbi:hypothetical protein [Kineothrix sp. MB12-C1]|uniref:hypothetical protein n=1 Tax=Kineothrix sp. MB12-C1 TaxID=3070215 RepID=UPI0027D2C81D|nr:hypothetical protein [Kineothrix sp. MB12-C1]WMC93095.1 hypothetical protein RBB56_02060 [Kineothrix sp. MB12-C1]
MNRRKKNKFLTFCFSLIPGAGEMYMGFMKMGVSLMGICFGLLAIIQFLNLSALVYLILIVWFYGFFHVHNLASMSDTDLNNVEDDYLFHLDSFFQWEKVGAQKLRKVIASALIIIGMVLLWNSIMDICYSYLPNEMIIVLRRIGYTIPQMVVGIGIVLGGFYMIKGKKAELNEVIIDVKAQESDSVNEEAEIIGRSEYGTDEGRKDA